MRDEEVQLLPGVESVAQGKLGKVIGKGLREGAGGRGV